MAHALESETVSGTGNILEGVPVDVAARFIEACSSDAAACGQTFHLIHPTPISVDEWTEVLERRGMRARYVSNEEWTQQFIQQVSGEFHQPLGELRGTGVNLSLMECLRELPTFDSRTFQHRLAAYDISCPDYEAMVGQGWLDGLRVKCTSS